MRWSSVCARWLAVVLLGGALIAGGCGGEDEDRPEVVLYCSVDQAVAEPIVAAAEDAIGVKILARYDTEASKTVGLVQKLRAERDDPLADVFWSSECFHTIRLAREGIFQPYEDEVTEDWPRQFRDPNGLWYGFALRGRVICYSPDRVAGDAVPTRLEDLLQPQWKGRIAMASPAAGTTGGAVASWFAHYGPEGAREILRGLAANEVRVVDGNSTAVRNVVNGVVDACLTDTDDVYAAQRNGRDVKLSFCDQGGDGTLAIPNTVSMIDGAPHPEAARKLMAFLLSPMVEGMLAESFSHNSPIRPDLAAQYERYAIPDTLDGVTYDEIADQLSRAIKEAREILP